jgi:hypothetical protein
MEQKSKSIGTTEYLVTQMDAIRALKVQTKLIKILGSGVLALVGEKETAKEKIAALIPQLMENFDDEAVNELILSLFKKGVFIKDGDIPKVVDFATHFAGKPMEMWQVVGFILEANFSMGE